jgi:hypothetical protein
MFNALYDSYIYILIHDIKISTISGSIQSPFTDGPDDKVRTSDSCSEGSIFVVGSLLIQLPAFRQ